MKNSILFYIFVLIIIIILIILYLLFYNSSNKKIENFLIPYTRVFNYTGTIQTFTVPTGVTSVNIYCWGAGGGAGGNVGGRGGNGGFIKATLTIRVCILQQRHRCRTSSRYLVNIHRDQNQQGSIS